MAIDQSSERWFKTFLNDDVELQDPPCILFSRPWESIPSESGPSRIHSSILQSSSLYDTSTLSEASLVRLAINALQGVESALKSIDKICTVFFSDPADRTYHRIPSLWNRSLSTVALGRILKTICRSGYIVYQLLRFVYYFRTIEFDRDLKEQKGSKFEDNNLWESGERPLYSLVNQAFAVSVGKILEGYTSALDTLHASAVMRRLSKTFDMSSSASSRAGLLTSVAHSEVTLLEVYLHTEGLRTQIDVLGNLCKLHDIDLCLSASFIETKFSEFPIGGNLLTYLYSQLKVSGPAHSGVLKFLFVRSFEPYSEFIRSWIYKAKFSDPYNEFIVEYPDSLLHYKMGSSGVSADFALATIREQDKVAVPCFLKEILVLLYRAGQQLQVLMKVLELSNTVGAGDNIYEEFLPFLRGSSSDFFSHSSPLTFNKGDLESMVVLRNNCHNQMMEKLQRLSVKLDLRYQQVVHCGTAPISVNIGGRNQDTPISSVWNENITTSSNTVNKQNLEDGALDSEASSMADENSYVQVPFNFSDCSSLASSEEQDQFDQSVETPDKFVNLEEQYLSALSFSSSITRHTPSKDELLFSVETDQETYKLKDPNMYFLHRQYDKTNNDDYSLHLDLKALSYPWISEIYDCERQHDKSSPSGSPLNICKHVSEENKAEKMADVRNSGLEVDYRNIQDTDEVALNCSVTSSRYGENITKDQHLIGTYTLPDLSSSESWKVKYNSKFFCANPIVTKHNLNYRTCMPEEKGSREFERGLSSFDFTSVQNPFSLPIAKSPGSPRQKVETKLVTSIDPVPSAACSTADVNKKEGHKGGAFLVRSSEMDRSPRWTEDARENVFQTTSTGGSGWQSLLSSSCNIDSNTGRDFETGLTGTLDIPLDFVIEKCLLEEILLQYRYVSKLTIKVLEEGFDLQGQLLALRRYHFMELADWADLFVMSLWHHKFYDTGADKRISEIQGLLELSIQRSSCERDSYRDRIYFYIKKEEKMSLSASSAGIQSFNYLGLGYRVDWPVNIILTSGALEIYAEIFSFLIQVKLALSSLTEAWCSVKEHMHSINQNGGSGSHKSKVLHFNIFMKLSNMYSHSYLMCVGASFCTHLRIRSKI
ncbi:uncharacterized protein LOC141690318 isoform X2 [Apium graveolens]|uniref:uncharacterized protein LOC141690318 isoform X2 n=1 Tax=Apium graveolens TaxID=4045 RepID=UPI003D7AC06D